MILSGYMWLQALFYKWFHVTLQTLSFCFYFYFLKSSPTFWTLRPWELACHFNIPQGMIDGRMLWDTRVLSMLQCNLTFTSFTWFSCPQIVIIYCSIHVYFFFLDSYDLAVEAALNCWINAPHNWVEYLLVTVSTICENLLNYTYRYCRDMMA